MNVLLEYISKDDIGLDFGCGPGPTLSHMCKDLNIQQDNYDPIFFNNENVFKKKYNFVTSTEVVEHLYNPEKEFERLFTLLKKNGVLGIMTQFYSDDIIFKNWFYIKDITHVVFYSKQTFKYLAKKYNKRIIFHGESVAIFYE